ncbi:alpha/beta fold hydrolase [Rummeliibacillus sp. JY-2-4R]
MNREYLTLATGDGYKLSVTVFEPSKNPIGHIHILHGMAEHQERYFTFAESLRHVGYLVSMHDHRGHGRTAKLNHSTKGYFGEHHGFDKVVDDVKQVTNYVRQNRQLSPMILFGHSLGSFIARRYSELYSIELGKVIYCGTGSTSLAHVAGLNLAKILVKLEGKEKKSNILNILTFGRFNHKIEKPKTKFDWLTSDAKEVQKYLDDDECGFISTNQLYVDFLQGIINLSKSKQVNKIRKDLPILLISGSDDPVGSYTKGIWKVANQFQKYGFHDVTVQIFYGMRHEILNEIKKEQVFQTIIKWLEKEE